MDNGHPYAPDAEAATLAPACVCNVASRVLWLRQEIAKGEFDPATAAKLARFITQLPFEEALLSGRMSAVDEAIKRIGEQELSLTPPPPTPTVTPSDPPRLSTWKRNPAGVL